MCLPTKYIKQIKIVYNNNTYDIHNVLYDKPIITISQEEYDKLYTFYNTYKDTIDKIRNEGVYSCHYPKI